MAGNDRTNEIASALSNACMAIYEDTEKQLGYKAAATALNTPLQNTRLDVVRELARLSHAQKWTVKEIKGAIKLASKQSNAPKDDKAANSVKTLRSEMKLFCDPDVREDVPDLIDFCEQAWADEEMAKAAEEGASTPIRKLFSRRYKLVLGVVRAVKNDDVSFASAEDVTEYCENNDPDEDAEKVAKKLERIVDQLNDVFDEFHNEDISACLDYLREIEAKDLLNSRAVHRAGDSVAQKPVEAVKPVAATPTPAKPETPPSDVADGAFDPLATTLNDDVDMMLAA